MIYFCVKFQKDLLFGVNLTFFAPWLPWQRPPFEFVQPLKSCHTLRWIFLQNFMKFEERNPNFFLILPFLFLWQLRQSLSNRFRFFCLSRSTRCGCCSYQVSSIFVWRVTCYDHFCVFFNFLAFWPFPWQRQPFWKNQHLKEQLHMAYDIPTRTSPRNVSDKLLAEERKKKKKKNNNKNNKKRSKHNMSPKLCLGAITRISSR